MKIKKIVAVCLIISSLFIFSSCSQKNSSMKENQTQIDSEEMIFAKLPSPPKYKKINDKETINKIINFIDSAEKTPINNNEKGWYILISLNTKEGTKQYSIINDTLSINGSKYKVNKEFVKDLEALYNEININEKNYNN